MPESTLYTHNLVSKLYAMKSFLETCLEERKESPNRITRTAFERVYGQADHALRIAKRLSTVCASKAESGKRPSNKKASLKQVWRKTLNVLRHEFKESDIKIIERIPDPFPLIRCTARDLKEIFYHLALNAIQAMQGKGKLIIRAQISFSTKEEPFVTIYLADTGLGIPQAHLPNLFTPFYTTKSPGKGNGLGLYLTRQLVLRNEGRIAVSSFEDAGTTFTLEFPLAKRRDS